MERRQRELAAATAVMEQRQQELAAATAAMELHQQEPAAATAVTDVAVTITASAATEELTEMDLMQDTMKATV